MAILHGSGSIVKVRNGYDYWYYEALSGKRRKLRLKINLPDGTSRNARNMIEARTAAEKIRLEEADHASLLRHRELAQKVYEEAERAVHAEVSKVDGIWETYLGTPEGMRPAVSASTRENQKRTVAKFLEWLHREAPEVTLVAEVKTPILQKFLYSIANSCTGRTANATRCVLRHVFRNIWRECGLDSDPSEDVKPCALKTERRREFTEEEIRKILDGFDKGFFYETHAGGPVPKSGTPKKVEVEYKPDCLEELRLLFLLLIFTASRLGDAVQMRWTAIDFAHRTIRFRPGKTSHSSAAEVELPMEQTRLLPALLRAKASASESEYVLPTLAARYQLSSGKQTISKQIQKIITCATGLKCTSDSRDGRARAAAVYGAHSFRHTFVSFCANAGVPLSVIQDIAGHTSPEMTQHYYHASAEARQKAIAAMADAVGTGENLLEKLCEAARAASQDKLMEALRVLQR